LDIMSLLKVSAGRRHLRQLKEETNSNNSPNFTNVNKKLNFNNLDESGNASCDRSDDQPQFDMDLDDMLAAVDHNLGESFESFSPCRTRSGCVYESGLKKRKFRNYKRKAKKSSTVRSRIFSGNSGTGSVGDCSENGSDGSGDDNVNLGDVCDRLEFDDGPHSPPPLNYTKNPVSRFSLPRERRHRHDIPSSPIYHPPEHELSSPVHKIRYIEPESPTLSFSPPTNTMRAMRLFDVMSSPNSACALTSPRSTPRAHFLKSRLNFDEDGEHRRASLPNPQIIECDSTTQSGDKRKSANINPFTPAAMLLASKKRSRSKRSIDSCVGSSREELQRSLDSLEEGGAASDHEEFLERDSLHFQPKRVRVADITINRYEEEFLEIAEVASGQFGTVKQSRHRLDGIVYAIKISKNPLRINSHDEKMAMNEVFAHAALMKHKHVVRYYNSWVEKGQVYIQNEYCEGGSLQNRIQEFRQSGGRFTEPELKKIIMHVAKGLHYIHTKQLVHLDIKPANIFISLEHATPSPKNKSDHSTDSGAASGDYSPHPMRGEEEGVVGSSSPGDAEKVHYKIGDLGHVASIYGGEVSPEEGDCRYMAPEFLEMEVERSVLPKADIFSLGLTIYEAASLRILPRNSLDDLDYEKIKRGELPYLDNYSWEFNNLLKSMVLPDPNARPSASRVLSNSVLNPLMTKTRSQLYKELREAREKVALLELQISSSGQTLVRTKDCTGMNKENTIPAFNNATADSNLQPRKIAKRLVGRGAAKSTSCIV